MWVMLLLSHAIPTLTSWLQFKNRTKSYKRAKKDLLGMKRREAINRTSATAQTNENRFLVVSEKNVQLRSMIRFFRRNIMFNHQGPQ